MSITGSNQAFGKVAVMMGGLSAEREISLKSGAAVLASLQRSGVDAYGVDVGGDILEVLAKGQFDRAFNMLHGRGGEDGVIQGALQLLDIPYTGSGVLSSALSMDKMRCKQLWQALGLPTPAMVELREEADLATAIELLQLPLVVKPSHEGSSVGMSKVIAAEQLLPAWQRAKQYDDCIIAEPWVSGGEFTIAILEGEALPPIKVETPREFYDFAAKYQENSTRYLCPCGLSDERVAALQALALRAFKALNAEGWGRVDVLTDERGDFWLLEFNSVPGMTDHSLVPMAAKAAGIEFDELVLRILAQSLKV
ncbi:MAG: D-alanine--D-alanine ligase [Gammaproteobacteria bacterium]|nr:D-alanine--D-alanine ligase [Gammaproteobacteria bacterium]MCF6229744.1 D-alanine--D-alanine ligase [Gammaproteobacteria bacterium]